MSFSYFSSYKSTGQNTPMPGQHQGSSTKPSPSMPGHPGPGTPNTMQQPSQPVTAAPRSFIPAADFLCGNLTPEEKAMLPTNDRRPKHTRSPPEQKANRNNQAANPPPPPKKKEPKERHPCPKHCGALVEDVDKHLRKSCKMEPERERFPCENPACPRFYSSKDYARDVAYTRGCPGVARKKDIAYKAWLDSLEGDSKYHDEGEGDVDGPHLASPSEQLQASPEIVNPIQAAEDHASLFGEEDMDCTADGYWWDQDEAITGNSEGVEAELAQAFQVGDEGVGSAFEGLQQGNEAPDANDLMTPFLDNNDMFNGLNTPATEMEQRLQEDQNAALDFVTAHMHTIPTQYFGADVGNYPLDNAFAAGQNPLHLQQTPNNFGNSTSVFSFDNALPLEHTPLQVQPGTDNFGEVKSPVVPRRAPVDICHELFMACEGDPAKVQEVVDNFNNGLAEFKVQARTLG